MCYNRVDEDRGIMALHSAGCGFGIAKAAVQAPEAYNTDAGLNFLVGGSAVS